MAASQHVETRTFGPAFQSQPVDVSGVHACIVELPWVPPTFEPYSPAPADNVFRVQPVTITVTPSPPGEPTGWRCPSCRRIYGPHVDECQRCGGG